MLSGGLDSTLLAALITRYNENLTAINLAILNLYSEYENAHKIAEYLNIPHNKTRIQSKERRDTRKIFRGNKQH
ncbi:MAG: asparagine synthase-related protein [archaeon GB-1867-035]|nr:asparagine synthase-related protein [Candidatus Culexmicrobium profundum]